MYRQLPKPGRRISTGLIFCVSWRLRRWLYHRLRLRSHEDFRVVLVGFRATALPNFTSLYVKADSPFPSDEAREIKGSGEPADS
jgi:hypothetical protein